MDSSVGGGHIPAKGNVQVVGVTIVKGGFLAIGLCLRDRAGRDVSSWNPPTSVLAAPVPILVVPSALGAKNGVGPSPELVAGDRPPVKGGSTRKNDKNTQSRTWNSSAKSRTPCKVLGQIAPIWGSCDPIFPRPLARFEFFLP